GSCRTAARPERAFVPPTPRPHRHGGGRVPRRFDRKYQKYSAEMACHRVLTLTAGFLESEIPFTAGGSMRARSLTTPLLSSLGIVVGVATLAGASSLYSGPGPRPGPDILYAAPVVVPQLENVGVWSAAPILVSGASAYRGGEFLYQDFLYDDHGAAEIPDPTDPKNGGNALSEANRPHTHPTHPPHPRNPAHPPALRRKPP